MIRMVGLTFMLASLVAAAGGRQDREAKRIKRKLASTKITIDFNEMRLLEFARQIARLSNENVVVRGIDEAEMPLVTIQLKGVSLESLLGLVLEPHELIYEIEDGILIITKRTAEKVVMEIYDIKELTAPLLDFPGVDIMLASNQIGVNTSTPDPEPQEGVLTGDVLVELIMAHTAGDTWDSLTGASVSHMRGLLIVRQTKRNQRQIRRFLNRMRALK